MSVNKQKKIAMINDMSGYGRCSITVALPIISAMKVQCCPVPTAILSNHTGYPTCFFDDYTEKLPLYIDKWKELGLSFDGVMTGFLGSVEQIDMVLDFIHYFKKEDTKVLVDPIMGDNGMAYQTYTQEMCEEMKELVQYADIITPNLTEACILTDTPYQETGWSKRKLADLSYKLLMMGPEAVVITGIVKNDGIINVILEKGKEPVFQTIKRVGTERPGTGDVFASVVGAGVIHGMPLADAVKKASVFVKKCIEKSEEMEIPLQDGVCFEECLSFLWK